MNKKIAVLGGTGFIGLNLAEQLIKSQAGLEEILLVDNFRRGKIDNRVTELLEDPRVKLVESDLTQSEFYEEIPCDFDQVFLLAAMVGVGNTRNYPWQVCKVNAKIILNTIDWILTNKRARLIFSSTSECYAGSIENGIGSIPSGESIPLSIQDIGDARFSYAASKTFGESCVHSASQEAGLDGVVVRFHNIYGPRMGFQHVIPQIVERFEKNESPFKIYNGHHTRAFCFVTDAVRALIELGSASSLQYGTYHIGNMTEEVSIDTAVRLTGDLMGYKGEFIDEKGDPGSVSRRCPDTARIETELGIQPEVSLRQGLDTTIAWYQQYFRKDL